MEHRERSLRYNVIVTVVCFALMLVMILAKVLVVDAATATSNVDEATAETLYTQTNGAGRNVIATNDVVGEKEEQATEEWFEVSTSESGTSPEAKVEETDEDGEEPKTMIGIDAATEGEPKSPETGETIQMEVQQVEEYFWDGPVLNSFIGVVEGPSGKETYYNLPMDGVIAIMRDLGFDEENYPYSINEDGCKCLGGYIMVAANLELRPKGTIVPTSLGWGIVADTGTFAQTNRTQLDIAVNW